MTDKEEKTVKEMTALLLNDIHDDESIIEIAGAVQSVWRRCGIGKYLVDDSKNNSDSTD